MNIILLLIYLFTLREVLFAVKVLVGAVTCWFVLYYHLNCQRRLTFYCQTTSMTMMICWKNFYRINDVIHFCVSNGFGCTSKDLSTKLFRLVEESIANQTQPALYVTSAATLRLMVRHCYGPYMKYNWDWIGWIELSSVFTI